MFKPRICGRHDPGLLFTQHQHGQSRIQTANLISFALFHENKPKEMREIEICPSFVIVSFGRAELKTRRDPHENYLTYAGTCHQPSNFT